MFVFITCFKIYLKLLNNVANVCRLKNGLRTSFIKIVKPKFKYSVCKTILFFYLARL